MIGTTRAFSACLVKDLHRSSWKEIVALVRRRGGSHEGMEYRRVRDAQREWRRDGGRKGPLSVVDQAQSRRKNCSRNSFSFSGDGGRAKRA